MYEIEKIDKIRSSSREIVLHLGYLNSLFAHIGSVSGCYALQKLGEKEMTPNELSAELFLDRTTVSRLTQDLIKKEYCKIEKNPKDMRSHMIRLTALGREKLNEINRLARRHVESALGTITKDQQEIISNGLALYAQALNESPLTKSRVGK